jgi:ribosomal protein L7/L12
MGAYWWFIFPLIVIAMFVIARLMRAQTVHSTDDMLSRQMRETSARPPAGIRDHGSLDANLLDEPEILREIQRGHKIEAIKMVRTRFGLGLAEAKELVERHS